MNLKTTYDNLIDQTETAIAILLDADDLCRLLAQELDNRYQLQLLAAIQAKIKQTKQLHANQRRNLYDYAPNKKSRA